MEVISKSEKEIDMTEGPKFKDVPYLFCIDCNAVMVPRVYRQYDYVPLCSRCRKQRRDDKKDIVSNGTTSYKNFNTLKWYANILQKIRSD